MGSFNDRLGEIEFLTRSATRVRILRDLHEDGSRDVRELRRRFDCDRTTLQRNLDALVEHGWVEHTNWTYRITSAGELLAAGLFDYLDTVDTAMELRPLLRWIPDDTFDFDFDCLNDADIVVTDPSNPDRILCEHIDALQATDQFRGFIPFIGRQSLEVVWRRVTRGEGRFEVVVPEADIDALQGEGEYAEMFADLLAADRIEILITDNKIPYYLGILDDIVQIGNTTDTGMRRAMLETHNPTVQAWAVDTYEDYKKNASLIEDGTQPAADLLS